MIFVIRKAKLVVEMAAQTDLEVLEYLKDKKKEEYYIAREQDMKFVPRITYVEHDGTKTCVYNSVKYWSSDLSEVIDNYDDYKVYDILGQEVSLTRFKLEYYNNAARIGQIDGRPGQVSYDMEVGREFISLFREECILTNFTNKSNTSPEIILTKLTKAITAIDIGGFREAKLFLKGYKDSLIDDFLTEERIDKYIDMLDAADAIEYATDEDYFYTIPESEETTTDTSTDVSTDSTQDTSSDTTENQTADTDESSSTPSDTETPTTESDASDESAADGTGEITPDTDSSSDPTEPSDTAD